MTSNIYVNVQNAPCITATAQKSTKLFTSAVPVRLRCSTFVSIISLALSTLTFALNPHLLFRYPRTQGGRRPQLICLLTAKELRNKNERKGWDTF